MYEITLLAYKIDTLSFGRRIIQQGVTHNGQPLVCYLVVVFTTTYLFSLRGARGAL